MTLRFAGSLAFVIAAAACSGNDRGPSGTVTKAPAALDGYCTVQSQGELFVVRWKSSQTWAATDTPFPSGTTVLLATDGKGSLEGYAFMDGEPIRLLRADKKLELVAGTDYSGSCPTPKPLTPAVVLRESTLFAAEDFSGNGCKLAVGTEVADNSFGLRGASGGVLKCREVQTACGFDAGYTKDLAMANLIKK